MSESELGNIKDNAQMETSFTNQDTSLKYEELNYGELETSGIPTFEFSSPISSISNCSSPDNCTTRADYDRDFEEMDIDDTNDNDFVSLEDLNSQISPPSDDEYNTVTLTSRKSTLLETIYEDVYLETPPGSPSAQNITLKRKRRSIRTNLSTCDEFKENVQKNL